jgi:PAS domain S-box-containing protein
MTTATKKKNGQGKATEYRYFNLIEHAADGIAIIQDGVFKLVNTALVNMSGHSEQELLGMPFTQILTPQSRELTLERYRARMAGKEVPKIYEVQAVTKDSTTLDIEINAALTEYEGRVADEIIIRDITERKEASETLKLQKAYFQQLFDNSPEAIVLLDEKQRITNTNKGFETLFGYTLEEAKNRSIVNIVVPKDRVKEASALAKALLNNKTRRKDTVRRRKDGSLVNVAILGYPIRIGKKIVGAYVIYRDITERKQAVEALRRSEEKYKGLFETSPIGVTTLDMKGVITDCNPTVYQEIGYAKEDLIGKHFAKIAPIRLTDIPRLIKAFSSVVIGKKHEPLETSFKCKNGATIWIELRSSLLKSNGKNEGVQILLRNITERKQAEEALQTERNKLQSVIDSIGVGLSIQDKDYNILYQNGPSKAAVGDKRGQKCYRAYAFKDDICEGCLVAKSFKDGKIHTAERTRVEPSGRVTYWENTASPIRDAQGNITSCIEITKDITERKKAEEALLESEEFNSSLLANSPNPISVINPDTSIKYVNPAFEKLTGYSAAELTGRKPPYPYWRKEDLQKAIRSFAKAMRYGDDRLEKLFQKKNGEQFWVEITSTPIKANGEFKHYLANWVDITDRKKAEQALADEATRRRILIEQSLDGIVVLDEDAKVYEANQKFAEMLGYTPEEVRELHTWDWDKNFPPEQLLEMGRNVDEKGLHLETKHHRKDGSTIEVDISINGAVVAGQKLVFCVCRDITERKKAEEALQTERNKLQSVISAMEYDLSIQDKDFNIIYQNESSKQSAGGDFLGMKCYQAYEYRDKICKGCPVKKAFKDGKSHTAERQRLSPAGEVTFWENTANPVRDAKGNIVSCLEIGRNITERKQMEDTLRESEERYRAVIEGAHDMIQSTALDGSINFVNEAWLDALGYTKEDLPKLNLADIISSESCPHCQEMFDRVIEGEPAHNIQGTFLTKSGRRILVEGNAAPRYIGDKVVATQGIFRDITERKQMEKQLQEKHEQLDAQNEELRAINEELQATEEELQHSRERLERMFESVTDGIVVTDLDGTILKVNERAVQMHGFASEDDMLGRKAFYLVAPHDHERISADIWKTLKEGLIIGGEYTMRRNDGTEFPGELSTSALKDGWGNVIGHISIARDITYRKQMEELFKTVTNSSPVGIYILQDGKFQLANPQFQKLTGYSEEELAKIDSMNLVLPEDQGKVRKKAIKMLKGELSSPYQFRVRNKAGDTRWVIETVTSIPYRGRQATLGNYIDITERKQAEEREDQLQQELNLAGRLASIGQLAAGVAHEINNPLTGVIGFSHLMLSRDIPEDMKKDLQVIHSEAQRVAKIVENLLIFAHQRKTGREYIAINDIITRVLELRAYEMKVNNIEVETRLDPELPATMADAGQFQQVFLNIVLNAEHFMTKAHNKGKLLVKTERIGNKIRASFTDDGIGISKENMDKIFNPFFTTKEVGKGTGLGLSICHGIITQHEGRIYAESEAGKGATFVIELPVVAKPTRAGKAGVTKKEPRKSRGAKILVVDDEAAILTFLHRLLTDMGHSVETINNADAALERLKTERYSLILLDIKLPGVSGIELYQQIEKIAPALTRRVMFITGDVMEGATRSFLEKAGVPHITKPIDIEELKKMMNNALNQTQGVSKASG